MLLINLSVGKRCVWMWIVDKLSIKLSQLLANLFYAFLSLVPTCVKKRGASHFCVKDRCAVFSNLSGNWLYREIKKRRIPNSSISWHVSRKSGTKSKLCRPYFWSSGNCLSRVFWLTALDTIRVKRLKNFQSLDTGFYAQDAFFRGARAEILFNFFFYCISHIPVRARAVVGSVLVWIWRAPL